MNTLVKIAMDKQGRARALVLLAVLAAAAAIRFSAIGVGSPFITIDDKTAFDGGFLVWFGQAPPQRMYIESWIYGIVCIAVYIAKCLAGATASGLGGNLVADAYRDFYGSPDLYVTAYRAFTLLVDLVTALLIYRIAVHALRNRWGGWAAVTVVALYLLSYNTLWSGIVARPDSILAFFCSLGVLLYLKSDSGRNQSMLLGSAVVLGVAAGQKLHGAFFAIFLCIDLLRVHGFAAGWRKFLVLALVSGFFFLVASGSLLFDPLMYVKLRLSNYEDDHSLWIRWGDQFVTMLRGTGWLALLLAIPGAWVVFARRREDAGDEHLRTIAVLAVGWLLLFAMIRQLRAYWMLPVLPMFYILAIYGATCLRRKSLGMASAAILLAVLCTQTALQLRELRSARYDELRDWVTANVGDKPFYVLGYDALVLPKNTACIGRTTQVLQDLIGRDVTAGLPFTLRHVKSWEERAQLAAFDMLDSRFDEGFEFYDVYSAPADVLTKVVPLEQLRFLIVQEQFDLGRVPEIRGRLDTEYRPIAEKYGAGGGALGLKYTIYERR